MIPIYAAGREVAVEVRFSRISNGKKTEIIVLRKKRGKRTKLGEGRTDPVKINRVVNNNSKTQYEKSFEK
jgi:hypothetical protein